MKSHQCGAGLFLLGTFVFCSIFLFGGPVASLQFEVGAGKGNFGIFRSDEGPETGPAAVIPSGNGLVVFDPVNAKLVRLDDQGRWISEITLEKGVYKDVARTVDGRLWMADERSRTVFRAAAGGIERAFPLPETASFPVQFDLVVGGADELVIADFSSRRAYWVGLDGVSRAMASLPMCLTLVSDSQGRIAGLCPLNDEDEEYSHLFRISRDGKRFVTKVSGAALQGARLLGFLADGRAVGFGVASQEPFRRELFVIDEKGKTTLLDTIATPLLFATRFGFVEKNLIWLNVSPIGGNRILFYRYEVGEPLK